MNFFDASLIKVNGKYAVKLGEYVVTLSEEKQAKLIANNVAEQEVTLGLRPEHLTLAEVGVPAEVELYEMMGASVHLHVKAVDRDIVMVVNTMNMTGAEIAALSMGAKVNFSFLGSIAHVFSKETGINLEA
jgi:multiple sugar transport system ATP-binding protein